MRPLVTGGGGFIGSHLVRALVDGGTLPVVVDDLSSGRLENLRGLRIRRIFRSVLDLRPSDLRDITHVFHLAAQVSVPDSVRRPVDDLWTNAGGTLHLLDLCRRCDVARVVFASSSAIYGDPRKMPVPEDANPAPSSPYGVSKWFGEEYCRLYQRLYGIETVALRPFNVYGPLQSAAEGGVIAKFTQTLLRKRPVTLLGSGRQTRDFVYVGDVVDAFLRSSRSSRSPGQAYNIGTGRETSLRGLIALFRGLEPGFRIIQRPPSPGDVARSVADVRKARRELGFQARVPLEEGLRLTFEFQRKRERKPAKILE